MNIPAQIVNPIGIDKEIQIMQNHLNGKTIVDFVFGKATKNYNSSKSEPLIYLGENEYSEILQSDNIKSHLFFFLHEESSNEYPFEQFKVSVIVFADLKKLYPTVLHRAEEEIINNVKDYISQKKFDLWNLRNTYRGATKALNEFNLKIEDFSLLQPFFIFRLDYELNISINNCLI